MSFAESLRRKKNYYLGGLILLLSTGAIWPQEGISIPLYVFVNDLNQGELNCVLSTDGQELLSLDSVALREMLYPSLRDELNAELATLESITLDELEDLGLQTLFSPSTLDIRIIIPTDKESLQSVSLSSGTPTEPANVISPENITGFINVFGSQGYFYDSGSDSHNFIGSLALEASLRLYNWIFLGETYFSLGEAVEYPELSIIRDFPTYSFRMTLGNYSLRSRGFQNSGQYQGISFDSARDMDPLYSPKSGRSMQFLIDAPSLVQVWVNGRRIQQMQLSPGRYDLRDFPFYSGISKIDLVIQTPGRPHEMISFYTHRDSELLYKGEHEFTYSAGILPWTKAEEYQISAYHEYGFFERLTMGYNFQLVTKDLLAGGNILWASPIGTLALDGGVSMEDFRYTGWAMNLGYRLRFNSNRWIPVVGTNIAYFGDDFHMGDSVSGTRTEYSVFLTQRLFGNSTFTSTLNVKEYSNSDPRDIFMTASFLIPFGSGNNLTLQYKTNVTTFAAEDSSLTVNLQLIDAGHGRSLSYVQDFYTTEFLAEGQQHIPEKDMTVAVGVQRDIDADEAAHSLYSSLNYYGSRFNGAASLRYIGENVSQGFYQSASLSSAIVFAGGYVGMSKPVNDSFTIIIPRYDLEEREIGVNKSSSFEARSGFLGPAVVSDMQSYRHKRLNVELLNPEEEDIFLMPEDSFVLLPSYQSGFVVEVGSEPRFAFDVLINDETGTPLPWATGNLSTTNEEPQLFFTDDNGRAIIYNVKAGTYVLKVAGFAAFEMAMSNDNDLDVQSGVILLSREGSDK